MNTLLIYDNTGYIYVQITGSYRTPNSGLQFIETEIPEGKRVSGVDVSVAPNVVIFEDIPLSETELLKKRVEEQEAALVELASLIGGTV